MNLYEITFRELGRPADPDRTLRMLAKDSDDAETQLHALERMAIILRTQQITNTPAIPARAMTQTEAAALRQQQNALILRQAAAARLARQEARATA